MTPKSVQVIGSLLLDAGPTVSTAYLKSMARQLPAGYVIVESFAGDVEDEDSRAHGFEWSQTGMPFDKRLPAGSYAEYRVGRTRIRIRIGKGRPVYAEDRWFQGAIPQSVFATH